MPIDLLLEQGHLRVDSTWLEAFCLRWKVKTLSLFGSALRDDFGPRSDFDFLITFQNEDDWDLWERGDLQDELEAHLGRPVDLVAPGSIRNPIKRRRILETQKLLYEAG